MSVVTRADVTADCHSRGLKPTTLPYTSVTVYDDLSTGCNYNTKFTNVMKEVNLGIKAIFRTGQH
jgi:hypothetical protein